MLHKPLLRLFHGHSTDLFPKFRCTLLTHRLPFQWAKRRLSIDKGVQRKIREEKMLQRERSIAKATINK